VQASTAPQPRKPAPHHCMKLMPPARIAVHSRVTVASARVSTPPSRKARGSTTARKEGRFQSQ